MENKEEEKDHSEETLLAEARVVLEYVLAQFPEESVIIVGHSMGGAIATKLANNTFQEKEKYPYHINIKGLLF